MNQYHIQLLFRTDSGDAWTESLVGTKDEVVDFGTQKMIEHGMPNLVGFHLEEIKERELKRPQEK